MNPTPAVDAALAALDFSEQSINVLFRACLTAAGVEWETAAAFAMIERLWQNDAVISAVEGLQDAIERERDAGQARSRLLAEIDSELRQPA